MTFNQSINPEHLSPRELKKAEYLCHRMNHASSPREAALYERQLKRLFQYAAQQEKGNVRANRKVKIETPKGTAEFRNKNVEDFARGISETFSRPGR
ncbi:hypothetical protein [Salibacterium aidingense]|uniref:hypothetical protein n=1 Tax=Salibacterium aidingense TaxID=384933 RepID=UPI003BEB8D88